MKFSNLIGKRLIGFQPIDEDDDGEADYFNKGIQIKQEYGENFFVRLQLFLGDNILNAEEIFLVCDNGISMWHWYSNWRLVEKKDLLELKKDDSDEKLLEKIYKLNKKYKSIGETIKSIDVAFNTTLDTDNIEVSEDEWNKKFPDGKDNKDYYFLKINTNTKILSLGSQYHDCHYPDTIWNFI